MSEFCLHVRFAFPFLAEFIPAVASRPKNALALPHSALLGGLGQLMG